MLLAAEKTVAAFGLSFRQVKSTNVVNSMSKENHYPSIFMEMACDQSSDTFFGTPCIPFSTVSF